MPISSAPHANPSQGNALAARNGSPGIAVLLRLRNSGRIPLPDRSMAQQPITLIGGGLVGALLAQQLAGRGFAVDVYEKRPDPRLSGFLGGRGRQRGDLVGLSRRAEHAAAGCRRGSRRALSFRPVAGRRRLPAAAHPARRRGWRGARTGCRRAGRRGRRRLRGARGNERVRAAGRTDRAAATTSSRWSRTRCTSGRAAATCASHCRIPKAASP